MITLDIKQIKEIIPQRDPMLFVDEIIVEEPGKRVVGIKYITIKESFFQGHFPGEPIMPGTLIIEAMAQASTFLFYEPEKKFQKLNFYLGIVKDARFLSPVVPECTLKITAEALRLTEESAYVKAKAAIEDKKVCEAELVFVRRKG
ncbi:3-hydroxyacyl-ACP dehydratase FabZ [Patescibacteria group bacterium]|nr:3-hydroxyacyl-ACP dehydratase FabZ [Patescibacteria group bacterium]